MNSTDNSSSPKEPAETLLSSGGFGGLTTEQVERAKAWMLQHYHHVLFLVKSAEHSYAPTDAEDKRRPELWKADHWHWFSTTFKASRLSHETAAHSFCPTAHIRCRETRSTLNIFLDYLTHP